MSKSTGSAPQPPEPIEAEGQRTASPRRAATAGVFPAADLTFVLLRDNAPGRIFDVSGELTVIGRREDCDLRIPLGDVSRRHCAIHLKPDGVRLQDLGSSNGTFVNDRRVQESPLLPGDRVTIGRLTFLVCMNGKPNLAAGDKPISDVDRAAAALAQAAGVANIDPSAHLNPTAQVDAGDDDPYADHGLDPSGAAGDIDELMSD